jgi:hypothetical protein
MLIFEGSYGRDGLPDGHIGTRDLRELDCSRKTLVTHGVVVLETDLELDGFEEVSLLLIVGVVQQLLDVATHSGCFATSATGLATIWRFGKTNRL